MSVLTFLVSLSQRCPARKVHQLITTAAGTRLDTQGYGNAARFKHRSYAIHDIESVFEALTAEASNNAFVVRGQTRTDLAPGSIINRRYKGDDASILDTPSQLIPVDLDQESAPDWLDTDDIKAVGDYLRSRMPPELRNVSCVVQLSAGYGLSKWTGKRPLLKARLWFMNATPLDSSQLRRWFRTCNASGQFATMDEAVAVCNQPIYTAAPIFENCTDPVPVRLALLLGEQDEAVIVPPAIPERPAGAASIGCGERCPERLAVAVHMIQSAKDGEKHTVLNRAAYLAGGFVAGGVCTEAEARQALRVAIAAKPNVADLEAAFETIDNALRDGMTAPLGVLKESAEPVALEESSDFEADLKHLAKAPAHQARATAKRIINRYLWRCPWKLSFSALTAALIAHLPEGSPAHLDQWIAQRVACVEGRARETAAEATALNSGILRAAGIEVVEVDSIAKARRAVESHPTYLNLVKAELGTGKTEGILKPLSLAASHVVAITHRVALVDDLVFRLQLENYKQLKTKDVEACSQLGLCLNSITNQKFGEVLYHAETVLVDEIAAVVRECHTVNGTLKKNAAATWQRLVGLLKKAKVACGVDADLSTRDVLALREAGRPVHVVVVRPAPAALSVQMGDYRQVWQSILDAAECGKPFRVFSDSANQIRKLEAAIQARNPALRVMAIHAKPGVATNGRDDVKTALADINSAVQGLDVLLHSPCVESGVSLTVPHFTRTFGIYGGSVAPAAFIQMMRRDRTATRFEIGILNNGIQSAETKPAKILANMEQAHRRTVEIGRTEGGYLLKLQPATPWDGRVVEFQAAANVATNHYAQNLWLALEARGFEVGPLAGDAVDKTALKDAADSVVKIYRDALLDAPDIDAKSREALEAVYQPDPDQSAAMVRYDCKEALAVSNLDHEALNLWDEGAVLPKIVRFETLKAAPLAGLAVDAVEDAASLPLASRSVRLAKTEAYRTLLEVLGFDVDTGHGDVSAETVAESFENLKVSPLRPVLEHSGICRFDKPPKYPIRWLGDALERFGLALASARPRMADGSRERVYRIADSPIWTSGKRRMKAPGWDAMTALVDRRKRRNADLVQMEPVKTIETACGPHQGQTVAPETESRNEEMA
jgi:hypothetical protein